VFECWQVWHPGDSVFRNFLYGSVLAVQMRQEFRLKNLGSHMNKFVTGSIAAVAMAVAVPALAADMAPRYSKAPMAPPVMVYNWTGCYVGGNVGGKWTNASNDVFIPATVITPAVTGSFGRDVSDGSFIGGGQVGCNWQAPGSNWVFGLEGDADWQRLRQTRVLGAGVTPPLVPGDTFDIRSDWQASARGRIGYAWDRFMLYATGGAAFTEVKAGSNFIPVGIFPATVFSDKKTLVGATVGAGVEYAFVNNWSLGVEGRYTWYGKQDFNAGSVAAANIGLAAPVFVFAPATQRINYDTFEVTARLNYKFNWGGPVVAKY
jgi:outer membrane immunogenic protein